MRLDMKLDGSMETRILDMAELLEVKPEEIILDSLALFYEVYTEMQQGGKLCIKKGDSGNLKTISTKVLQKTKILNPEPA